MDASKPPPPKICPQCDAPLQPDAERCWLCGMIDVRQSQIAKAKEQSGKLAAAAIPKSTGDPFEGRFTEPGSTRANGATSSAANLGRTFSLSTLFLWTTLAAVVMGVTRIATGPGVVLAMCSILAAARTVDLVGYRERRRGQQVSPLEKILVFIASLAGTAAIGALCLISFVSALAVVCGGIFSFGYPSLLLVVVIGAVVGGASSVALFFLVQRFFAVRKD
jgi:hypothetical protein